MPSAGGIAETSVKTLKITASVLQFPNLHKTKLAVFRDIKCSMHNTFSPFRAYTIPIRCPELLLAYCTCQADQAAV